MKKWINLTPPGPLVKAAFRCSHAKTSLRLLHEPTGSSREWTSRGVYIDMTTPALAEIMDAKEAEKLFYEPVDLYSPVAPNSDAVKRAVEVLYMGELPVVKIFCRQSQSYESKLLRIDRGLVKKPVDCISPAPWRVLP